MLRQTRTHYNHIKFTFVGGVHQFLVGLIVGPFF